jgi:hypothetical protein
MRYTCNGFTFYDLVYHVIKTLALGFSIFMPQYVPWPDLVPASEKTFTVTCDTRQPTLPSPIGQ